MNVRYLPLYEGGQWIAFPAITLWFTMAYPNDEAAIRSASDVLVRENIDTESGRQADQLSVVASSILRNANRHLNRRRLCGSVAQQIVRNIQLRGEPQRGRAIFGVSRWAEGERTVDGKPLGSDPSALRRYFNKYRDVAHLLAAYESLSEAQQVALQTTEHRVLVPFLMAALKYEDLLETAFEAWNPWRVPLHFRQTHDPERWDLRLPPEDDQLRRIILEEYYPDAIR